MVAIEAQPKSIKTTTAITPMVRMATCQSTSKIPWKETTLEIANVITIASCKEVTNLTHPKCNGWTQHPTSQMKWIKILLILRIRAVASRTRACKKMHFLKRNNKRHLLKVHILGNPKIPTRQLGDRVGNMKSSLKILCRSTTFLPTPLGGEKLASRLVKAKAKRGAKEEAKWMPITHIGTKRALSFQNLERN